MNGESAMERDTEGPGGQLNFLAMFERLIRIETKLDQSIAEKADHEARLRAIERWKYALPITLVTAIVSGVTALYGVIGR